MTSIAELLKPLEDANLYSLTGDDWEILIHISLTEPTCPTVVIRKEDRNSTRYRFDRDTAEEGIAAAVSAVMREVVHGQTVEPECPFTNAEDRT